MKRVKPSLFGKRIKKRRPAVSARQQQYYYIKYAISVLRVIAWAVLVLGFISALVWGIAMGGVGGGLRIVIIMIGSFLAWLALLAARELLRLFMDVKQNTRSTSERSAITKQSR
jgi:ABC-type transport system involved in cytochrome bd biosynthesis fused ATPase/permease subunit